MFNLRDKNFKKNDSFQFQETNFTSELLRGEFLAKIGEKLSFIIGVKIFLKKNLKKTCFPVLFESYLTLVKRNLPLDFKLIRQILKGQIRNLSFSNLKQEDSFRKNLAFFFFQGRKWFECYHNIAYLMKFGKREDIVPNSFDYWICIPKLIGFFMEKPQKIFSIFKKNPIKKELQIKQYNFTFENLIGDLKILEKILKTERIFTSLRFFFLRLFRKKFLFVFLGGYRNLNIKGFQTGIQVKKEKFIICEEIKRSFHHPFIKTQKENLKFYELDFFKQKLLENFDLSVQKIIKHKKSGKF
mmetsp:Transcript_15458/g.31173  ORF Transcript_15458/g.31173 Transcript_15458/m.31173 type:complete len:299 (+) Transcript_15458:71-967(+)